MTWTCKNCDEINSEGSDYCISCSFPQDVSRREDSFRTIKTKNGLVLVEDIL